MTKVYACSWCWRAGRPLANSATVRAGLRLISFHPHSQFGLGLVACSFARLVGEFGGVRRAVSLKCAYGDFAVVYLGPSIQNTTAPCMYHASPRRRAPMNDHGLNRCTHVCDMYVCAFLICAHQMHCRRCLNRRRSVARPIELASRA